MVSLVRSELIDTTPKCDDIPSIFTFLSGERQSATVKHLGIVH